MRHCFALSRYFESSRFSKSQRRTPEFAKYLGKSRFWKSRQCNCQFRTIQDLIPGWWDDEIAESMITRPMIKNTRSPNNSHMFHLSKFSSFLQIQKIRHDTINLNTVQCLFCQAVFKWQAIAVIILNNTLKLRIDERTDFILWQSVVTPVEVCQRCVSTSIMEWIKVHANKTCRNTSHILESLLFQTSNRHTTTLNSPRQLKPNLHVKQFSEQSNQWAGLQLTGL